MNKNFNKLFICMLVMLANMTLFAQKTNSSHIHVQGYYRNNGTYVQPHNRTSPNSTNKDNFSTIGNTNPYIGQIGWITPDNKSLLYNNNSIYSSPFKESSQTPTYSYSSNYTIPNNVKINLIQNYNLIFDDYEMTTLRRWASFRTGADAITDIIEEIPSYDSIKVIGFKNNYWQIYHDGYIGYVNEMYVQEHSNMARLKNNILNLNTIKNIILDKTKVLQNYDLAFEDYEMAALRWPAKFRENAALSNIIKETPWYEKIKIIGFKNGYWKVYYDGYVGYVNEMYVEKKNNMDRFKNNELNPSLHNLETNTIQNYKLTFDDCETATLSIQAKFRKESDAMADIINVIPIYTSVKIIGFKNNYWKVYYGGYIGYIHEKYVKEKNSLNRFRK